jgi:hypothetical protein
MSRWFLSYHSPDQALAEEQAGKRRLAHRERITPHVLTIELDQVEGVEEHAPIVPSIADVVEARDPVLTARHRLVDALKRRRRAIDQKRCSLPCAEWRVGGPRYA